MRNFGAEVDVDPATEAQIEIGADPVVRVKIGAIVDTGVGPEIDPGVGVKAGEIVGPIKAEAEIVLSDISTTLDADTETEEEAIKERDKV